VFAERQIRSIMPMEIQEFLNSKATSKSLATKIHMVLRLIFSTALGQFVIDRDPMTTVQIPDAPEGKKRALTEEERRAALSVGETHPDGLLIMVLYYSGVRIGEALGLQWRDIDFKKREMYVRRDIDYNKKKKKGESNTNRVGNLKSESAYRTIPIAPPLLTALSKKIGIGETFIFQGSQSGVYLSQSTYQRLWDKLMVEVYKQDNNIEHRSVIPKDKYNSRADRKGKPGPKPKKEQQRSILTPHYFRHNFATLMYDAGVDVLTAIKIFGHKDKNLLLDIYTDLSNKKQNESTKRIDDIF
jgi:integrase